MSLAVFQDRAGAKAALLRYHTDEHGRFLSGLGEASVLVPLPLQLFVQKDNGVVSISILRADPNANPAVIETQERQLALFILQQM